MSFVEFLLFALISAGAALIAEFFAARWGVGYWLILAPVAAFWIGRLFAGIKNVKTGLSEGGRPRPPCRFGKCKGKDYTLVDPRPGSTVLRCRCGDTYLSQGTYFSFLSPDGAVQPYMKLDRAGAWVPDTAERPS